MTISVTIKTADWPAKLTCYDTHTYAGPRSRCEGSSTTTEFIAPHSERDISVTDTRSISVEELPADWTDLDGRKVAPDKAEGALA